MLSGYGPPGLLSIVRFSSGFLHMQIPVWLLVNMTKYIRLFQKDSQSKQYLPPLALNCPCTYREGKFLAPGSIIVGEGKTITWPGLGDYLRGGQFTLSSHRIFSRFSSGFLHMQIPVWLLVNMTKYIPCPRFYNCWWGQNYHVTRTRWLP
jgi:hypothetical protein